MENWYKIAKKEINQIVLTEDINNEDYLPDKPKWKPVNSSWISDVAYYEPLGMFEVKLKNGSEYSFSNVPKSVYNEFMDSKSKGKFLNRVIRPMYNRNN